LRLQKGFSVLALAEFKSVADTTSDPQLRAEAWFTTGNAERRQGLQATAELSYRRALADASERRDKPAQARMLTSLASLLYEQQQIAGARDAHASALSLYRELGDARGAAIVLQNSGLIAQEQGLLDEAQAIFEEALKLHAQLGHRPLRRHRALRLGWTRVRARFTASRPRARRSRARTLARAE
jgi:tetratricopeptide (TPR) repeat protein